MSLLAGVDIGGTKTAVALGHSAGDALELLASRRFATPREPQAALEMAVCALEELLAENDARPDALGVSCGGPLDSRQGLVLSPPNLPGWDRVDVISPLRACFQVPVGLQNDANAGALAEWRWGAGRGCRNMLFLTFGTGLGAGLILDGRLYAGTNDLAGEAGHVRLANHGPRGYGKAGSFEGFCSGGGIARRAKALAKRSLAAGRAPVFCPNPAALPAITAQSVAEAAHTGDPLAISIYTETGRRLGQGLAFLIDLFNPQRIVLGGIYPRQRSLLEAPMRATLQSEALPQALSVCQILPAAHGEHIGDYAVLAVASQVLGKA
jgi:glucokinase